MQKFTHINKRIVIITVAALLVAGGLTTYALNQNNTTDNANVATQESTDIAAPLPTNDLLSIDQIAELDQVKQSPSGIVSIELEEEHGAYYYKVLFEDTTERFFSAKTGEEVPKAKVEFGGSSKSADSTDSTNTAINHSAAIGFAKAREIALGRVPGGVIEKIETGLEDGIEVYSVRFTNDARVDVNAANGNVVRFDQADSNSSDSSDRGRSSDDTNDDH